MRFLSITCLTVLALAGLEIHASACGLLGENDMAVLHAGCPMACTGNQTCGRTTLNGCWSGPPDSFPFCHSDEDCKNHAGVQQTGLYACKPTNHAAICFPSSYNVNCGPVYRCECKYVPELGDNLCIPNLLVNWQGQYDPCEPGIDI